MTLLFKYLDFQVPDIEVLDIQVPAKMDIWVPDIEVPVILKWGGWVKKSASMRGTAGGVVVRGTSPWGGTSARGE